MEKWRMRLNRRCMYSSRRVFDLQIEDLEIIGGESSMGKSLSINLEDGRIKSALKVLFDIRPIWMFSANEIMSTDTTQTIFGCLALPTACGFIDIESLNDIEDSMVKILDNRNSVTKFKMYPNQQMLVIERPRFSPKIPKSTEEELIKDLKGFARSTSKVIGASKVDMYYIDRYENKHKVTTVHLDSSKKNNAGVGEFVQGMNLQSKKKLLVKASPSGIMMSGTEAREPLVVEAKSDAHVEIVFSESAQTMLQNVLALSDDDRADIIFIEGNLLVVRIFKENGKGTFFRTVIGGNVTKK